MRTRTKSFVGMLMACIGGGAAYILASQYFAISADTTTVHGQRSEAFFLIGSVLITLYGVLLLIFSVVGDSRGRK